jgi:methionyl-tRNA formyltransferase
MRSLFFGTPDFAIAPLEAWAQSTDLLAVICQPDKARGRGQKLSACPTKAWAEARKIPCFTPDSLKKDSEELDRFRAFLQSNPCELALVVAYGKILPNEFLKTPKLGSFNLHASLLPRWRGAAPIQRAIEAGDPETGVCLQKMVEELDAGDVLGDIRRPLDPNVGAKELFQTLSTLGAELVTRWIQNFDPVKSLAGTPQDKTLITHARKVDKAEGNYSVQWTAPELHRKVMALEIWPQVTALLSGTRERVKIKKTRIHRSPPPTENSPGTLFRLGEQVFISTIKPVRTSEDWGVEVLTLQMEGKKEQSARQFIQDLAARQQRAQLVDFTS